MDQIFPKNEQIEKNVASPPVQLVSLLIHLSYHFLYWCFYEFLFLILYIWIIVYNLFNIFNNFVFMLQFYIIILLSI